MLKILEKTQLYKKNGALFSVTVDSFKGSH